MHAPASDDAINQGNGVDRKTSLQQIGEAARVSLARSGLAGEGLDEQNEQHARQGTLVISLVTDK